MKNATMKSKEATRTRDNGTQVTNTEQFDNPGLARIDAIRKVLTEGYAKVDGVMVDSFSASAITQVYDKLNDANKEKFRNCSVSHMAKIAFSFVK